MSHFNYVSAMAQQYQQEQKEIRANCSGCLTEPSQQLYDYYLQAMGEVGQIDLNLASHDELLRREPLKTGRIKKEAEDDRDEEAPEMIVLQETDELGEWQESLKRKCELTSNIEREETSEQLTAFENSLGLQFVDDAVGSDLFLARVKPFACTWPGCDFRARYKSQVETHVRSRHTGELPFKCPKEGCGKRFHAKNQLNFHQKSHLGQKRYACSWPRCSKSFDKTRYLKQHVASIHEKKRFQCDFPDCDKKYNSQDAVKMHKLSVHFKEKPFACSWPGCDFRAVAKNRVNFHMKIHLNVLPFECQHEGCGKKFRNKVQLKLHEFVHQEQRQYVGTRGRPEKAEEENRDAEETELIVPQETSDLDEWQDNLGTDCESTANNGNEKTSKLQAVVKEEPEEDQTLTRKKKPTKSKGHTDWQLQQLAKLDLSGYKFDSFGRFLGLDRPKNLKGFNYWLCDQPGCAFECREKEVLEVHLMTHRVEINDFALASNTRSEETSEQQTVVPTAEVNTNDIAVRILESRIDSDWRRCDDENKNEMMRKRRTKQSGFSLLKPNIENKMGKKLDLSGYRLNSSDQFMDLNLFMSFKGPTYWLCDRSGCAFKSRSNEAFENHLMIEHGVELRFACEECGKTFNRGRGLRKHRLVHDKRRSKRLGYLFCDHSGCEFECRAREALEDHLTTKHGVEFSFPCEDCGKTFNKRKRLRRHRGVVHKEKRFQCDYADCGKKFRGEAQLKEHQRLVHSYDKEFVCDWPGCEFRFANIARLNTHRRRVHEKVKKVACPWSGCSKRFFSKHAMRLHHNLHTGKQFKCKHPDCDLYFSFKSNMTKHFASHHEKQQKP